MNFKASLDYLYGLQRFGVKLGLENMQALQSLQPNLLGFCPMIHVAGTNGKGSVSAIIAEILKQAGFRVGLYTSPHLQCFTERIRINGTPIAKSEVVSLIKTIKQLSQNIPLTFFEATTAMALLSFQYHQVEVAVVETGLGGRLDATNIIQPSLCLITPISYDHTEHLGATLSQIAAEKAGIFKKNVPVIIGRQPPEAQGILLSIASSLGIKVGRVDKDYRWEGDHHSFSVSYHEDFIDGLTCPLPGKHQLDNFAQAVAAVFELGRQGVLSTDQAIRKAGTSLVWPGRLEWLDPKRKVLLDVSHNHAGISCLVEYLKSYGIEKALFVVGLSGQRMPKDVLTPLVCMAEKIFAVPVNFDPVSVSEIAAWAMKSNIHCAKHESAADGFLDAISNTNGQMPIVVCGSLYLVAELREQYIKGVFNRGFAHLAELAKGQ